jgi:D-threonine aldolase
LIKLQTPALLVDGNALEHNLSTMSAALPGPRLRPHVKAHKCTSLARRQAEGGHTGFTCATIRECEGMAAAGLGSDLMLANEVVDASRLGALVRDNPDVRVTLAVDSDATVDAAAAGGVRDAIIDVNVGRIAELARSKGMNVRGVMGYEGHVVGNDDRSFRESATADAMKLLVEAHADVGGELISAGGTGTYDINTWANEIQAGSYALMDTAYGHLDLPFRQALTVLATVISVSPGYAVADCGLKALGMDHGNPTIPDATVFFCSDEHVTFIPDEGAPVKVGDQIRVVPAHIDPTIAYHERMHITDGDDVVETWPVDLRGW